MPETEVRPTRREELNAISGLLSAAGLPVEDLDAPMLDAFVAATDGGDLVGVRQVQQARDRQLRADREELDGSSDLPATAAPCGIGSQEWRCQGISPHQEQVMSH